VLGHVLQKQLGLSSKLAELINHGQDVHRLLASQLLHKEPTQISKDERNSVKPISFGRPGGMGVKGLQRVAKNSYGLDLTEAEVEQRIQAYHTLCPELNQYLQDDVDVGLVIAQRLRLTPALWNQAQGQYFDRSDPQQCQPQSWLGHMLLKVLREPAPTTTNGRPY